LNINAKRILFVSFLPSLKQQPLQMTKMKRVLPRPTAVAYGNEFGTEIKARSVNKNNNSTTAADNASSSSNNNSNKSSLQVW
jgi:hypothetical protein